MIEYIKVCRPEHWLKNIFIVFGHAVAVIIAFDNNVSDDILLKALLSLFPACLIASANYVINEILDAPFDKLHPTKKLRGAAAGKVSIKVLWWLAGALTILGLYLGHMLFEHRLYLVSLVLLLLSGFVYNVPPIRLKDKVYFDVIAESFNNPIRLWLGWFAIVPANISNFPPFSITLSWWAFGALLMTGKRYAEIRFIGDYKLSGLYRSSFKHYSEKKLIIAMITYANLFCFCAGVAIATYKNMTNLVLVFPFILLSIIFYFDSAMSKKGAKLEPEKLMQNILVLCTLVIIFISSVVLLYLGNKEIFQVRDFFQIMTWPPKW